MKGAWVALSVIKSIKDSESLWCFAGSLDKNTVVELMPQGVGAFPVEGSRWTLDFQKLKYIDSAGLAFCLECLRASKKNNILLEILNAPDRLHALARAQGIEPLLIASIVAERRQA